MTNPEGVALYSLCLAVGILPVIAFLVALVLLDSYKLVRLRSVLLVVALGGLVALISLVLNPALREALGLNAKSLTRYVAPIVEEVLKGLVIVAALRSRRIGFLVDAAIWGFAIGAGFAMVENTHYSIVLGRLDLPLWIIRGFGTAVMHGGTTAIMAVTSKLLTDRANSQRLHLFVPGLAFAILIHSAFNHFYLSPTHSALTVIVALPLLFSVIFRLSENATQTWLGVGFDTDQELLRIIKEGRVSQTQVGRYLRELRGRFAAETVVDMLCLIRLHLELSLKAKGILLMQKAGFAAPAIPGVEGRLKELRYLEGTIGKTGMLALHPIFHMSDRDLWQLHLLRGRRRK